MVYLICGDIHGNLPALELMLSKENSNYDFFICHGDVVNYGPWSNECVELLNTIKNSVLLQGNHEEYFLKGKYDGSNFIAKTFFNFCIQNFTQINQIKEYKNSYIIKNYTIQHTLNNNYIYIDSDVHNIDNNYIIGHSHQQFTKQVGRFKLINTGSVGQNRTHINCINYIIYDDAKDMVQLKYLLYDHKIIIDKMKNKNYPKICIDYYMNKNILNEI